jgi:hypothetical protein
MPITVPAFLKMLEENSKDKVFRDEFFENRDCRSIGTKIRTIKPILHFRGGKVQLGFNIGTRTNGVDQARWPEDLGTEIIT